NIIDEHGNVINIQEQLTSVEQSIR
ncbi:unnamed protein product, partial [Allacma fusca]